jgi:hypothetical protein
MFRRPIVRILFCLTLSSISIAAGFLAVPGIRHRHEGGKSAHSHARHGHRHHHHGHGHFHSHGTHSHDHHTDDHSESSAGEESAESHIHFVFLGIELTFPDFLSDEPAPLVDHRSESSEEQAPKGDVIRLPSPFSLAQLIHVLSQWSAVGCTAVRLEDQGTSFGRVTCDLNLFQGLDRPAPPLPPPQPS